MAGGSSGMPSSDAERIRTDYQMLWSKLTSYFRHRRCSEPEDLAHDVLARVLDSLSRGTVLTVPILHFCYGVARNVYLESVRHPQGEELDPNRCAPANESPTARVELLILANEVLKPLSEEERRLVWAHFSGDDGAARQNDMPESTRRVKVFRALEKLRRIFGGRKIRAGVPVQTREKAGKAKRLKQP